MKQFYSKILLFGEYSVMLGSEAITLPFRKFHGSLAFPETALDMQQAVWSNSELKKYSDFLTDEDSILSDYLDIPRLQEDIQKGIFFKTTIPAEYGLGSSGAIVASLFSEYGSGRFHMLDLIALREILAVAEGYFHGTSSGTDPLSILLNSPLSFKPNHIEQFSLKPLEGILRNFYLCDTGLPAGTGNLMNTFRKKTNLAGFGKSMELYCNATNEAVESLLSGDEKSFRRQIKLISEFQLTHFIRMIPDQFHDVWKKGLESDQYYFKLCGSGGGGYLLLYLVSAEEDIKTSFPASIVHLADYIS
jgi:mevalonate kinase